MGSPLPPSKKRKTRRNIKRQPKTRQYFYRKAIITPLTQQEQMAFHIIEQLEGNKDKNEDNQSRTRSRSRSSSSATLPPSLQKLIDKAEEEQCIYEDSWTRRDRIAIPSSSTIDVEQKADTTVTMTNAGKKEVKKASSSPKS